MFHKYTGRIGKSLRKLASGGISYGRHPFGVTCLDCGFLALGDTEVSTANRILLHAKGLAKSPPLEELWCSRSLWVDYELSYFATDAGVIFDEVRKQRRHCEGFPRYRPGWSPTAHQDLLLRRLSWREKIYLAVIVSLLTFVC